MIGVRIGKGAEKGKGRRKLLGRATVLRCEDHILSRRGGCSTWGWHFLWVYAKNTHPFPLENWLGRGHAHIGSAPAPSPPIRGLWVGYCQLINFLPSSNIPPTAALALSTSLLVFLPTLSAYRRTCLLVLVPGWAAYNKAVANPAINPVTNADPLQVRDAGILVMATPPIITLNQKKFNKWSTLTTRSIYRLNSPYVNVKNI